MRSASRLVKTRAHCVRRFASEPNVPVLPSAGSATKTTKLPTADPPRLPPDVKPTINDSATHQAPLSPAIDAKKAAPFTEPIVLADAVKKPTHKLRNTFFVTLLGGALLYGGGLYAALNNDTAYELYTEFVPYGEDLVLYAQEQEFRQRFTAPDQHSNSTVGHGRSASPNVYIPLSGAQAKIREDAPSAVNAKILQPGPQNSAIKHEDRATPGGASHVQSINQKEVNQSDTKKDALKTGTDKLSQEIKSPSMPARATSAKVPAGTATSAKSSVSTPPNGATGPAIESGAIQDKKIANAVNQTPDPQKAQFTVDPSMPMPQASLPIKTFDVPNAYDRSVERLQFALNGIIKAANEYGSSPFFKASLENAKDEVIAINKKISEIRAEEDIKFQDKLKDKEAEFGRTQQAQVIEINKEIAEYEKRLALELETEKERLNSAYAERLSEEVKKVEGISEQKLQNELMEQAIDMQRRLNREIKSRVEEERGGRLGKLEGMQKSIAELKQLSVDSTSYIEERSKLQDLEVALCSLKTILSDPTPGPFLKELAAVKELAGQDQLLRASIDAIDRDCAESGVMTLGQLSDRFRTVSEEVRKSALLPEGAGVAGHASSWLLSKFLFRKRGMVEGDDVEAVLARTEAHLEANDLDSATREMNQLTGWAKIISSDWLTMARRYLEVQQSVDLIEQSLVLRALQSQA